MKVSRLLVALSITLTLMSGTAVGQLARSPDAAVQAAAAAQKQPLLASLKEFAYGASHEINNPLANISTRAQALLAEEPHPERRKKLAASKESTQLGTSPQPAPSPPHDRRRSGSVSPQSP